MSPELLNEKEFARIVPMNERENAIRKYNYAGGIIFTYTHDGAFITLVSDSDNLLSWPSGGREVVDIKPSDTAIRETFEELPLFGFHREYLKAQFGVIPPLVMQRNSNGEKRFGLGYPLFINLPDSQDHLHQLLHKGTLLTHSKILSDASAKDYLLDDEIKGFRNYKLDSNLYESLSDTSLWRNPHWNIPMLELVCSMGLYANETIYKRYKREVFDSVAKPVGVIANGSFMTERSEVSLRDWLVEFPIARMHGKKFFREWYKHYMYEKGF